MNHVRVLAASAAFALLGALLFSCGGSGGGSSGGDSGDAGGDTGGGVEIVTAGLVFQLDAARYDGSMFGGTGCATTLWTDLISATTGTLGGFAPCGLSSGWNGTGVGADPYRLSFDGADDIVSLGINTIGPKLQGASAVTVDLWFRYTSLHSGKYDNTVFFVDVSAAKAGIWINVRGDGPQAGKILVAGRSRSSDSFLEKTGSLAIPSDTWTQITAIFDYASNQLNLAHNGTLDTASTVAFGSTTYNNGTPSTPDSVSYSNSAGSYLEGEVAYLSLYNEALSSDSISQNCNALADRFDGVTCP